MSVAHRLPDACVADFQRDGFLPSLPVLPADEVAELRRRVDHIREELAELEPRLYEVEAAWSSRPDQNVCHFLGGWQVDPVLHDLVFDPRVTVPAAQLLGVSRLRFWHDQVFFKPPHHPGVVPWHQDYSYWTRTGPPCHITVFLALDATDQANGCVEFVPGSHHWGLLPRVAFDAPREALLEHLSPAQRAVFRPRAAPLRAGEASFHDCLTVHGSAANRSARPRCGLVLNYMAADTRVLDGSAPLVRHAAPLAEGEVVDGPLFPVVLGG